MVGATQLAVFVWITCDIVTEYLITVTVATVLVVVVVTLAGVMVTVGERVIEGDITVTGTSVVVTGYVLTDVTSVL